MHLVPTEATVNKLFDLGFNHLAITPYEGCVSVSAKIISLKADALKALADIPGFHYLTNETPGGKMKLVFYGEAVEEMEG